MASNADSSVTRSVDPGGDEIKTKTDVSGFHIQIVGLDENEELGAFTKTVPLPGTTTSTLTVAGTPTLRFAGFAVLNQRNAAVQLRFRNGTNTPAPLLYPIRLEGRESRGEHLRPGLSAPDGIFLEVESGTREVDLVVFYTDQF